MATLNKTVYIIKVTSLTDTFYNCSAFIHISRQAIINMKIIAKYGSGLAHSKNVSMLDNKVTSRMKLNMVYSSDISIR